MIKIGMVEELEFNVVVSGLKFPESPIFDEEGNLWFVEIAGGNLSKWNGVKLERFKVYGTPNGAVMDKNGCIWFCDSARSEVRIFDPNDNKIETKCSFTDEGKRLSRPNDLIFDSVGNLLFSDHADGRIEAISNFYVLPKGDRYAKVISSGKLFANGLALRNNGDTLVYAETYNQQIWIADWDKGQLLLRNERHFAKAGTGPWGPDGLAFDEYENLFVAVFNEGRVNAYNKAGKLIRIIKVEGSRPTSCAFDPFEIMGLVVTEAEQGRIISYPTIGKGLKVYHG